MKKIWCFICLCSILILTSCNTSRPSSFVTTMDDNTTKFYKVSFDSMGGTAISDVTLISGSVVLVPANPSKGDSIFNGWYTDRSFTTPYDFSQPISSDLKLYAYWLDKNMIEFNTMGGSYIASQMIYSGYLVSVPESPNRIGYVFNGWHEDVYCKKPYDFSKTINGSQIIYASWLKLCTVSFNTLGGSSISNQVVVEGTQVLVPSSPTKSGYEFNGWYLDSSYTITFDFSNVIDNDLTLYAKWN